MDTATKAVLSVLTKANKNFDLAQATMEKVSEQLVTARDELGKISLCWLGFTLEEANLIWSRGRTAWGDRIWFVPGDMTAEVLQLFPLWIRADDFPQSHEDLYLSLSASDQGIVMFTVRTGDRIPYTVVWYPRRKEPKWNKTALASMFRHVLTRQG